MNNIEYSNLSPPTLDKIWNLTGHFFFLAQYYYVCNFDFLGMIIIYEFETLHNIIFEVDRWHNTKLHMFVEVSTVAITPGAS